MKFIVLFFLIVSFVIIGYFDMLPLYKNKKKKELYIYSVLLTSGFVLSVLLAFGIELPKISKGIEMLTKLITG